ncbi:PspC domain-containing protein [Specibacter sp. AOP5-B1-6]|uniref:PspC domain-containing protein n=1 Tax=Specibacter sp. AOP5-B1-6 TaxID=3457653 RepID=UPI00402BB147
MNNPQDTPEQDNPEQPAAPTPGPEAAAPGQNPGPIPGQGGPANDAAGYPAGTHAGQANSAKFFQWLRGLGVQRGSSRWVGGVCSGLANKWGIDPVIVRGLAVVLTLFFGAGLLAYGVAWALLPEPDGRIHVEEVARGNWSTGMTGAGVVTLLGLVGPGQGFIFGRNDGWFPWPLFWIAVVAGFLYWGVNYNKSKELHGKSQHSKTQEGHAPAGIPEQGATPPEGSWPGSNWQGHDYSQTAWQAPVQAGNAGPGATSFATRPQFVPNPQMYIKHRPVKTTPRLGAAASLLVLGLAAVIGALVLLLDATGVIDLNGYQAGIAAAAAAITAGVGIVAAGIMGRSAGGLGTFSIIALVFASLLSLPAQTGPFTAFNNTTWTPTTISAAEAGRTIVLGNATFDLTKLDGVSSLDSELALPLKAVAASVTVKVPATVPVTIHSELAAVSFSVNGKNDGDSLAQDLTTELNPNATGPGIVIALEGAASNIEIVTVK